MTAKDNPASKLSLLECLFTEPSQQTESSSLIPTCFIYIISDCHSHLQSLGQLKGREDIKDELQWSRDRRYLVCFNGFPTLD